MTREARETLPELLDAISFRRGVLLGHSDGATIAAIYAGSVEDFRVRGLVLMAPHFFAEASGLAAISEARIAYGQGDLRAKLRRYHRDVDAVIPCPQKNYVPEHKYSWDSFHSNSSSHRGVSWGSFCFDDCC